MPLKVHLPHEMAVTTSSDGRGAVQVSLSTPPAEIRRTAVGALYRTRVGRARHEQGQDIECIGATIDGWRGGLLAPRLGESAVGGDVVEARGLDHIALVTQSVVLRAVERSDVEVIEVQVVVTRWDGRIQR